LFDAGLADPRGGEYRQIEIGPPAHPSTTHAWYFPQGFAVCWDGLVHRAAHPGAKANLASDAASGLGKYWTERPSDSPWDADLVGVVLLLRLGKPELARQLLTKVSAPQARRPARSESEKRRLDKLAWLEAAGVPWLSGAFHQAVEAHALADDQFAIEISDVLLRAHAKFETSWTGLCPADGTDCRSPVAFLEPVPDLRADSERRLSEPPRPPFDADALRRPGFRRTNRRPDRPPRGY
jgi:hypothetical protein